MSFLLLAATALLFNACKKENFLVEQPTQPISESQNLNPTITVEEVKNWYEKTLAEQKGTLSFTRDTTILPNGIPNWTDIGNGFSKENHEFFMATLNFKSDVKALFKLLVTRQNDGNLLGKLVMYVPNNDYHVAKKGKYSVEDYTGAVIYTDLKGKFEYGFYIRNGLYQGVAKALPTSNSQSLQTRCISERHTMCLTEIIAFKGDCLHTIEVILSDCPPEGTSSTGGNASTPGGLGGSNSGSGGGAWNRNQAVNLFTYNEKEALRTKFRNAELDDIFYTLELHQDLLQAANLFLDTKGWNSLNNTALKKLINSTSDYQALGEYLTTLSAYPDFYNTNVALNFPSSAVASFSKYTKAGFSTQEFVELFKNQNLFSQVNAFLIRNANSLDAINTVLEINSEFVAENFTTDITFVEDAQLHMNMFEQSQAYKDHCTALNAFSTGGGNSGDPLKGILVDLMVEGAQEWAENFLGIDDLNALKDLLEKGTDKAGKLAFRATRIVARFIAKKNPIFNALSSLVKAKQVYGKVDKAYKAFENIKNIGGDLVLKIANILKNRTGSILKNIEWIGGNDGGKVKGVSALDVFDDLRKVYGGTAVAGNSNEIKFNIYTGGREIECKLYINSNTPRGDATISFKITGGTPSGLAVKFGFDL